MIFNKTNPWKMYPKNVPCFCGCGYLTKYCNAQRLMPQMITEKDYEEASRDMDVMIKYVRTLKKSGIFFTDKKRSKELARIFAERDKVYDKEANRSAYAQRCVGNPAYTDDSARAGGNAPGDPIILGPGSGGEIGGSSS